MTRIDEIRCELKDIAEKEATYLYRLAWRCIRHGVSEKTVREIREEAYELHTCSYPDRLIRWDAEYRFKYAFKIM